MLSPATASLTSQAYARFRADILAGVLAPARKLKVEELRDRYGIGAGPIREALTLLVADGLVERADQRGFRVVDVSEGEFEELLRTRCWLEERALRESMARGGGDWEERIVVAFYRLSRMPRSLEKDRFVENPEWEVQHKTFHQALIGACGSSILLRFCNQLYDQNVRYRRLAGLAAHPARDVTVEHREIMDATLDRDADRAAALLTAHYARTGQFLTPSLGAATAD
jgi:GntR family carbon starvation induced transcriptional regulator